MYGLIKITEYTEEQACIISVTKPRIYQKLNLCQHFTMLKKCNHCIAIVIFFLLRLRVRHPDLY